jgi:GNAT superfamily N-acetyltransferase
MNASDLLLRAAVASEAGALTALAVRSKAHWGYSAEFIDACRDELTYTPAQIDSAQFTFTVVQLAGSLVGFYALEKLSAQKLDLKAMFVEPDHIGAGIGRALMTHARNVAAHIGAKQLGIQSDPHAQAFYEHMGATYVGQAESDSIAGRYLPSLNICLD